MRLAIIDLGTNSIRFDVHELKPGGVRRLHREKLMVKLGQDVFLKGKLNPDAIQRTTQALERFSHAIKSLHVAKVVSFATSAIREAEDRNLFLRLIQKRTGIKIQVISGEEEARLIAKGILSNEKLPKGKFGLIDIGGGSTEISLCSGKQVFLSVSLSLGVARLQQVFLKKSPPKPVAVQALRAHIQKELRKKCSQTIKFKSFLGSSGSIQMLAKILRKNKPNKGCELKVLEKLTVRLSQMTRTEILSIPGMEPRRAELILAGALILEEVMSFFSAKKFLSTDYSLRDGILEEEKLIFKKQSQSRLGFHLSEISKKTVLFGVDPDLLQRSVYLCQQLFQRLKSLHRLKTDWLSYLVAAAMLKDVGKSIAFSNHEEHSYYIAKNLDTPFLLPWESVLIAELCRFHKAEKVLSNELPFDRRPERRRNFLKLLALLQIVEALGSGFSLIPPLQKIRILKKEIRFALSPSLVAELDAIRLERKTKLFEKVFRRRVKIQILKPSQNV